jgi:GNAT superfamily N-acetyltransferase
VTIEAKPLYSIRSATLGDAAEIARLGGELGYPATADEISARLQLLLHRPNHFLVVAASEADKELLGWIAAEERALLVVSPCVEIMGLVVDHNARRIGLGHALIASVEGWAKERGVKEIAVRSNVIRRESHPFYEGLGYIREKSQHVYHKAIEA